MIGAEEFPFARIDEGPGAARKQTIRSKTMRNMTTSERTRMLYNLLPPTQPADQAVLNGWRDADITVTMHALRRARVQWRRGRQGEARAWLQVAEAIVHGIFQDQEDFGDDVDSFGDHTISADYEPPAF